MQTITTWNKTEADFVPLKPRITDFVIFGSYDDGQDRTFSEGCYDKQFMQVFFAVDEQFVADVCKRLNMLTEKNNSRWHYDYEELE